jgi:hypothetical protein
VCVLQYQFITVLCHCCQLIPELFIASLLLQNITPIRYIADRLVLLVTQAYTTSYYKYLGESFQVDISHHQAFFPTNYHCTFIAANRCESYNEILKRILKAIKIIQELWYRIYTNFVLEVDSRTRMCV